MNEPTKSIKSVLSNTATSRLSVNS